MKFKISTVLVISVLNILFFSIVSNAVYEEGLIGKFGFYYELVLFLALISSGYVLSFFRINYFVICAFFLFFMLFFAKISNYSYDLRYIIINLISFSNFYFLLIALKRHIFYSAHTIFFLLSLVFILLNFFFLHQDQFYSNDGRYLGVMFNVNQTVYLIGFCLIYVHYFTLKFQNFSFFYPLINISLLTISILFLHYSESRSFMPIVIFFIISILRLEYKSLFFIIIFIGLTVLFIPKINNFGLGRLFDPDDPSILTRLSLQADFIDESANSFLKPHGPNAATIYVKSVTKNDEFHLHNDFLAYLFDYGFIFIAYLFVIIRVLSGVIKKMSLKKLIVILFYFSSLMHGYLFSFFISIPLMFVLSLIINNTQLQLIRCDRASLLKT